MRRELKKLRRLGPCGDEHSCPSEQSSASSCRQRRRLSIRRRFSRLAGLLEIADQEFETIRDDLGRYAGRVEHEIEVEPSLVEIDDVSLDAFARNDVLCRTLDTAMAEWEHMGQEDADDLHSYVDYLRHAGLTSIEDLRRELLKEKDVILCQFKKRTTQEGAPGRACESFSSGMSAPPATIRRNRLAHSPCGRLRGGRDNCGSAASRRIWTPN